MQKFHVKKDDIVTVISGNSRGKTGKVLSVVANKNRVIVEGCALIKKHQRKTQQNPKGAIVEREGTIHISNVMLKERYDARKTKGQPEKKTVAEE